MPRKDSRPGGAPRPSRSRRPGRAGIGPGPAYRPSSTGGGTRHKPGTSTSGCAVVALVGLGLLLVLPALVVAYVAG